MSNRFLGICLTLMGLAVLPASAQLAITEVMSSATEDAAGEDYPDFWELTNFGTNRIDLTDYCFTDDAGAGACDRNLFEGEHIDPGESIIFMRRRPGKNIQTLDEFRAWWGETNLPERLQVIFYDRPGFSADNDAVQLWHWKDEEPQLVDRVVFGEAERGFTFTYDPLTGALDAFSEAGVGLAFRAAQTLDVGSPGWTTGLVPLSILAQPRSVFVDSGDSAAFQVRANGLPRPRYQWFFNGTPIPGAAGPTFIIQQTTVQQAGSYTVEISNGIEMLESAPAILDVNTSPSCARIEVPPANLSITLGQQATFTIHVRGYPLPAIQWYFNHVEIPGATNRTLVIPDAGCEAAGIYGVVVTNPSCTTNATARLNVTRKPRLALTEAMPTVSTNAGLLGFREWWELTNFDDYPVNLRGYRWDDLPGELNGAFTITNDVIVQPGESIIFAQRMSREQFIDWWGRDNLPENLQVIRYTGNGLKATADAIRLWNPTALRNTDYIFSVGIVHIDGDFAPIRGVSLNFWCDGPVPFIGVPSAFGQCGAFQAARSGDVGSPGFASRSVSPWPLPRILRISRDAGGVQLICETEPGQRYELQYTDSLCNPAWTTLGEHVAAGTELTIRDPTPFQTQDRFYRLVHIIQMPCHEELEY
jgi:hypothetical protein